VQELSCKFTPADGGPVRDITLRIHDPTRGPDSWSAPFEILGFDKPERRSTYGVDWAQALEWAPKILALLLKSRVESIGGTLDPPFYTLDPEPFNPAKYPPEVLAALGMAPDGSPLPGFVDEDEPVAR
jgi:hypothetical protein